MYHLFGLPLSANTTKTLYVAEELGLEYEFTAVDVSKGENRLPAHMERHPLGKLPTLTHNGAHLFESASICRYLARTAADGQRLYPKDQPLQISLVDQWMDFYQCHLGRWLAAYGYETVIKPMFKLGDPDQKTIKEAMGFIEQQWPVVEANLVSRPFFVGDHITLADLFCFPYMEIAESCQVEFGHFENLHQWYQKIKKWPSVQRVHKRLEPYRMANG